LNKVVEVDPNNLMAYVNLGAVFMDMANASDENGEEYYN